MEKTFAIGFRLYAEVNLTEKELLEVVQGDSSSIADKIASGKVALGGGDSYIPGSWLVDHINLPESVHEAHNGDDIDLNI